MQAIEIEADITQDGHIHLPDPLRPFYGRHARMILLFEEMPTDSELSSIDKPRTMQGIPPDQPVFDAANPRANWFKGYQAETDVNVWETLDESEKEPGVAFTTQGKPTLASLAGCWEGESLERGPQGDYETRQEFE